MRKEEDSIGILKRIIKFGKWKEKGVDLNVFLY